jgi:hypothetical protein
MRLSVEGPLVAGHPARYDLAESLTARGVR